MELLGTFADANGQIVGTPFAIGDLGTFTVPSGATQLQLGVNDCGYAGNAGSLNIQITGIPSIPVAVSGVPQGSYLALPTNSVAPAGYTLLGTTRMKYKYQVEIRSKPVTKTATVTLALYQKD